jgi:flagellar hook-associated protein 1 FlgK
MISLHGNLEIAKRAMQTSQLAMAVLGNNIANVNTPGYSRQRPVIKECPEVDVGAGIFGTGSQIVDVLRTRDWVLDNLYRYHQSAVGRWSGIEDYMAKVETLMNEPGDGGLSDAMGAFWASWEDLANEPESASVRSQVRMRGQALCDGFHRLSTHLRNLQTSLGDEIVSLVDDVNRKAVRLAEINRLVQEGEVGGHEANALRDERDLLIDDLSELVDAQVEEASDGTVFVTIGTQILVQGRVARQLEVETDPESRSGAFHFIWANTEHEAVVESGLVSGYLMTRNERIESYITQLDNLAQAIVSQVNAVHSAGYGLDGSTGTNFFDPDKVTAADISIDTDILSNLDLIAASAGGQVGDGQNALALADLRSARAMSGGSATFDSFYGALVGQVGLDSKEATSMREAEESLVLDIENQRSAVSGVSLDEEMTYLLSYQHAYEAMVRVASTIDEMLSSLITDLG